jgi:vacuolar-type H+-ATPase subunit I/STV1
MSENMGGLIAATAILPIIVWFIIAVAIGVWIYRDAESRGMSGAMWLIIGLILGIIGLIVYVIVRKPKGTIARASEVTL